MRYIGGKSKLAKHISEAILSHTPYRNTYIEPFVGGGSVFARMAPNFYRSYAGDAQTDLIKMWQAVMDGWVPPSHVSEETYAQLKTGEPSPMRGFVGFGGSFGGKWFGGYARGKTNNGEARNYVDESSRAIMKIKAQLDNCANKPTFINRMYEHWSIVPGTVIYCDPPYADVQGYSTGGFDTERFWNVVDHWSSSGAAVFVSEYKAPPPLDMYLVKGSPTISRSTETR